MSARAHFTPALLVLSRQHGSRRSEIWRLHRGLCFAFCGQQKQDGDAWQPVPVPTGDGSWVGARKQWDEFWRLT